MVVYGFVKLHKLVQKEDIFVKAFLQYKNQHYSP